MSDKSPFDPLNVIGIISAAIGSSFFIFSFMSQLYSTYKSQNTVGVNKPMFLLHCIVANLFFVGAVLLAVEGGLNWTGSNGKASYGQPLFVNACIFITSNYLSSMACLYHVLLKSKNQKEAKKLGISEEEHYKYYCSPEAKKNRELREN